MNNDTLEKLRDDIRGTAVALSIIGKITQAAALTSYADRLDAIMAKPDMWLDDNTWDAVTPEYKDAYYSDEVEQYTIPLVRVK